MLLEFLLFLGLVVDLSRLDGLVLGGGADFQLCCFVGEVEGELECREEVVFLFVGQIKDHPQVP